MSAEADLEVRVRRWDMVGVVVSAACVVHCVAMPLVLGLLPALGLSFLAQDGFHQAFAVLVLLVALGAFVPGYRSHRRAHIPLIGGLGVVLLASAAFAPLSVLSESIMTAIGGTILVLAHILNRRLLAHTHAHPHPHAHALSERSE